MPFIETTSRAHRASKRAKKQLPLMCWLAGNTIGFLPLTEVSVGLQVARDVRRMSIKDAVSATLVTQGANDLRAISGGSSISKTFPAFWPLSTEK
jgi:hypothetical protein